MKIWFVHLNIPKTELLKYDSGQTRQVFAHAHDGKKIVFPVERLKPYITHEGIHGTFKIQCNEEGKLHSIEKLHS